MTDVRDRTALVTGAGSGIGRLLAGELARRGARLVLWDIDDDAVEVAVKEVETAGADAHAYCCDVSDRAAVYAMAERVQAEVGEVDVLVNNAGIVSGQPFLSLRDEDIERTFAVNTLGLYWTTKAFLPAMVTRGRGHLVTIASAAGLVGVARQADYSASKHAAVGFDQSLRVELAKIAPAIRTTVVCPYYIDTGMFTGVRTRFRRLLPILRAEDVARRIADAIDHDRPRLLLPPLLHLVPLVQALPPRLGDRIMGAFGVNVSMDHFEGRHRQPARPGAAATGRR
jgi:all-trans-retinol dehydrogenase (NAD+)